MEAGENDITYLMEEWAVVGTSQQPGEATPRLTILKASSSTFAAAKLKDLDLSAHPFAKRGTAGALEFPGTLLIVEAPVHPHNSRLAPTPKMTLTDTEVPSGIPSGSMAVRVDFSETEDAPQRLQVIHSDGPVARELVDFIKSRLELDRGSMKRHRTIVFATVRIGDVLELQPLATVTPKCCCGGVHCV